MQHINSNDLQHKLFYARFVFLKIIVYLCILILLTRLKYEEDFFNYYDADHDGGIKF